MLCFREPAVARISVMIRVVGRAAARRQAVSRMVFSRLPRHLIIIAMAPPGPTCWRVR